eukprot:comp23416_c0_seq1/m.38927 comp23416_c0_seq1/g.38927  ORF comp23416_c0_seq1/g.38927 comp23416_c0_seq1/m.38927 type:complete len:451 (-) comp23416_c0_seq1:406-1758(-)
MGQITAEGGDSHGSNFAETIFNVVTTLVGVGVVGLPYAMAQAGWIGGIVMITIATLLAMYCGRLLAYCMNDALPGHQFATYVDLGEHSAGKFGKFLGFYASYAGCYAASIFFIVAGMEQFQTLFPDAPLNQHQWSSVFTIVVLPFCYLKTLGHVGFISFSGAATSAIVMVMTIALVVSDYRDGKTVDLDTHTTLLRYDNIPVLSRAFVTIIFSLGGMCVFPEINRCMKKPQQFGLAIGVSCAVTYVFYMLLACTTYAIYGDYLLTSSDYANVVKMLSNNWMAKVIAAAMQIHILAAFVVTVMPIFRAVEDHYKLDDRPRELMWRVILRTCIVSSCLVIAVLVPFFGDVMALVGASMDSLSGVILPSLFFIILFYKRNPLNADKAQPTQTTPLLDQQLPSDEAIERHLKLRPGKAQVVVTGFIFVAMVGVAVLGSYQALSDMESKMHDWHL